LLPDCSLLPFLGEAQPIKAHFRVLRKQISQPLTPSATRRDDAKQALDHNGLGIKTRRILEVGRQGKN
jgi:hypothetical protein